MTAIAQKKTTTQQDLILEHYPMVRAMACRIHSRLPRQVEVDDLISAGVLGLIAAIDRFDHTRSVPFDSYARHRVRGSIMDALRAMDWVPRSVRRKHINIEHARRRIHDSTGRLASRGELAHALDMDRDTFNAYETDAVIRSLHSLDQTVGEDNQTPLVQQIPSDVDLLGDQITNEMRDQVVAAIRFLPERERTAVALYYLHELSLKEIGKVLGVTESRACQLRSQGIKRLRFRLRRLVS